MLKVNTDCWKSRLTIIVLQVDVPLVPASQCNAALKRALNQKKPGVGDRFQLSKGEVRWSPNKNSDVDLHPIPKNPTHERNWNWRCARGQRMGKMLALVTEEALSSAKLSPEGDRWWAMRESFWWCFVGNQSSLLHQAQFIRNKLNQTIFCLCLLHKRFHFARWTVVGLVAWGIGCGSHVPGVYTNVHHYKQWINSIN